MKFGIVFKEEKLATGKSAKKAEEFAKKAIDYLRARKQTVVLQKELADADFIVTFGGDGTLIHAACEYAQLNIPFVGINTGRVGFLTAAEADDWKEAIEKLIKREFFVSKRMFVEAQVVGAKEVYRAINEVVVKGLYRIVDLEVKVRGGRFLKIVGDGAIVATQTGSTAYSLSSGGPIVDPELNCFLVTPINPIGLPIPSVVLSPQDQVLIKVVKGDDVSLIMDGQEHTKLKEGQEIKIRRGEYDVKFGYFEKERFLKALNAKFGFSSRSMGSGGRWVGRYGRFSGS